MNRLVLRLLRSRWGGRLGRSLLGLQVHARRTGRLLTFPVQYAAAGEALVVVPGHPERKSWWRIVRTPSPVQVLDGGRWHRATAAVVSPQDEEYAALRAAYQERWPRIDLPADQPLVRIRA